MQPMSVRVLLNRVETSDDTLEANLCTMLQTVCETNQYRQTGEEQKMVSKEDDDPQLMGDAKMQ